MNLTEGESRALLTSATLVTLAALGRVILGGPGPALDRSGLAAAGDVDSALAVAESIQAEAERRRRPLEPGERIDPNSAAAVELDRLPGVGPDLARAIVEARRREGPYRSWSDLERVPGIGATRLRRLAPFTTLPAPSAAPQREALPTFRSRGGVPSARGRIDVNRASERELTALPGVGRARAAAIIRWRSEHGPFGALDQLADVPGIGPATVELLRAFAVVGP